MDYSEPLPDASTAPHPDSILRMVSAVQRFSIPCINPEDKLSFAESFRWCASGDRTTQAAMQLADDSRRFIRTNMADGRKSHASLSRALADYIPLINQILLSVKVQPEMARLDKTLLFSWSSGIEKSDPNKKFYLDSEALMFELVLALSTYALSESNVGCGSCVEGDFPDASRQFSRTAGVFKYLADDLLPSWMANSRDHAERENETLAETRTGVAEAFSTLFQAMSQQMAVATVLAKPGVPNYALLGKLCLGVAEEMESFTAMLRSNAPVQMGRMDPEFLKLVAFSTSVQRCISHYFLARSLWNASEYGVAISALKEAVAAAMIKTQAKGKVVRGVDINGPLHMMRGELNGFKMHLNSLLASWEKENSSIYFEEVPHSLPSYKALKAIRLNKAEEFVLDERDPLPFGPPPAAAAEKKAASKSSILLWWKQKQ